MKQFGGEYNTVFNEKLLKYDGKIHIINLKYKFYTSSKVSQTEFGRLGQLRI